MIANLCRRFSGKVVLLTGSSRGIGRATACEFAREGADLILNARGVDDLDAVLAEVRELGAEARAVAGDICRRDTIEAFVQAALGNFGRIDVLVNNVGGGTDPLPVEEIPEEEWNRTVEKNLSSAFRVCQRVVPVMRKQGRGRVVNVSSVAGQTRGHLSGIAYSAAKAGLQGMTRHLAWDLGPVGITVNAVAPGLTSTARADEKWARRPAEERQRMLAGVALGRFADPSEVARAVLFLASDDASYITGVTLDVSGGVLLA